MTAMRQSFTVPSMLNSYATETLYLTRSGLLVTRDPLQLYSHEGQVYGPGQPHVVSDLEALAPNLERISQLSVALESGLPSAVAVLELLKPRQSPTDAASWLNAQEWSGLGLKAILQLAAWLGGRIRVRSGGFAGSLVVCVSWV